MIGHPTLIEAFLEQSLAGYRAFVGQVVGAAFEADTSWSRVQGGVGLLRLCALPRLLHLFRALPPAATLGFAEKADQATLDSYEKLLTAGKALSSAVNIISYLVRATIFLAALADQVLRLV